MNFSICIKRKSLPTKNRKIIFVSEEKKFYRIDPPPLASDVFVVKESRSFAQTFSERLLFILVEDSSISCLLFLSFCKFKKKVEKVFFFSFTWTRQKKEDCLSSFQCFVAKSNNWDQRKCLFLSYVDVVTYSLIILTSMRKVQTRESDFWKTFEEILKKKKLDSIFFWNVICRCILKTNRTLHRLRTDVDWKIESKAKKSAELKISESKQSNVVSIAL
jgi:hypothetical protein